MKAPLRTILKNFLDHVEDLETRRALGDDQYETEFQELKKLTDKLKEDPAYPCTFGLKDVNRPKNRYKDIVPYDFSRVILPKYEGVPCSDYINASYVKGASGAFAYIAAQGPLPNTVIDFWRMIWVCDVQVIVMACNETESGKHKCEAYWPSSAEETKQYGNITIELINTAQVCSDFLVRTFLVKCESEMRDVYQFHYTTWPDHGVPDTVQPILDLVRLMRDCQASETVPIIVHCSAGCGRTGTICAVDYVWACLRHGKLDEDFSLYQIALELRRQRIAMIQTKEQYILAHRVVSAMFSQQLRVIDCHIYENIDEDGEPLMWKEFEKDKEFFRFDPMAQLNTKDKSQEGQIVTKITESIGESKSNNNFYISTNKPEKNQGSSTDSSSPNSSVSNNMNKVKDHGISGSQNSESSFSRNSILSQQSNEDSIPFIDEDEVCVRPNCGRAYLDIPSCDSISKLVNCFDPFVDKVSFGTDDSSPEGDPFVISCKMKDFQMINSSKTLDRNTKISVFKEGKNAEEKAFKPFDSRSDIVDYVEKSKKQSSFSNRESYPPCSNSESFQKNLSNVTEIELCESLEDTKCAKKIGKATVVRRPSISKLKALFEKSGISSQRNSSDGSKRLLFRNNSQQVSRAGSAPPSLNCMDKTSAVERESILMMVTRKFRSSSVRTEREMQTKRNEGKSNRKSATETVKDGFNALTRTMSFNINKTFKSYSPSKTKTDTIKKCTISNPSDCIAGTYKPKSPDSEKGNSMWYDKPCLPRAIAVVKPTGKFEATANPLPLRSPPPPKTADKNKPNEQHFNYMSKPTKLKDFFSSLNKKDTKESLSLWYNDSSSEAQIMTEKEVPDSNTSSSSGYSSTKTVAKTLPFLPISSWKKVGYKSPLSSPDSPKNFAEQIPKQSNSKFYTDVLGADTPVAETVPSEKPSDEVPKCPVPEEIIPLNLDVNNFWPSSHLPNSTSEVKPESEVNNSTSVLKEITSENSVIDNETIKKEFINKPEDINDVPPAIPKKMVIGKNKNLQSTVLEKDIELLGPSDKLPIESIENKTAVSEPKTSDNAPEEKSDLYMNVNIKAIKNLEQIENTLRKNPRGAIIDLTSRESYSMEEELVNAVNQLSESSEKVKLPSEYPEKKQTCLKTTSKFPGYEVIWPEVPNIPIQKSDSGSKVAVANNKLDQKELNNLLSDKNKGGLCYSPPLRRSVNASLALSKSQSCGSLDWHDTDDVCSNFKEPSNTPTKRLVKEAVVELNTLLNQLTTRTLSEDVDFDSKSKEKFGINKPFDRESDAKSNISDSRPNDTVVHSVTLVTKSYNTGSSPKEEEIVFHFPPPPRGPPPPKVDSPVESFNIFCKDGSLVVKGANSKKDASKSASHKNSPQLPQPAPRKSKQTDGLKRSSSYTNISLSPQNKNKGYENVFLEKYQTMSRLQIKPDYGELNILDKPGITQKLPVLCKSSSSKRTPNYVNITDVQEISKSDDGKPGTMNTEASEFCNKSSDGAKNIGNIFDNTKSIASQNSSRMIMDDLTSDSTYGKIYRSSSSKMQTIDNTLDSNMIRYSDDIINKRKPVPSKKTERAPLPPNIKQTEVTNNEVASKINSDSMIPKKLPSKKLEKAPPPPTQQLQKCSSAMIHPKKNLSNSQHYVNFPASRGMEDKIKLPAVHENVSNATEGSIINNKPVTTSVFQDKFVNRGLSHSQSDVSVFLALKERKIQTANQDCKVFNLKSLMNKKGKQNIESVNISSSDSDSSYERIFLTKDTKEPVNMSNSNPSAQTEKQSPRTYKKETPVAPPRSKRRSTTEVQYTKVKAKDAILKTNSKLKSGSEAKNSKILSNHEDEPPAIPLKTKDAFEIPVDVSTANVNKKDDIQRRPVSKISSVK